MKTQNTTYKTFKSAQLPHSNFMAWMKTTTQQFFKSRTQMEQLSYNSSATSGSHCNHILHTMVQESVFVTPLAIWLQQVNHQR
jgi:hypothetical protein